MNDFNTLFISVIDKLELAETHSECLLDFIRLILPTNNNLPNSVYRIKKRSTYSKIKTYYLCKICESKLVDNKCPSETCYSHKTIIKKHIQIHCANVTSQLEIILSNHLNSINDYLSIIKLFKLKLVLN